MHYKYLGGKERQLCHSWLHKRALYNVRNSIQTLQTCIRKNSTSISAKQKEKMNNAIRKINCTVWPKIRINLMWNCRVWPKISINLMWLCKKKVGGVLEFVYTDTMIWWFCKTGEYIQAEHLWKLRYSYREIPDKGGVRMRVIALYS